MFDNLTARLSRTVESLRGRGRITEENVAETLSAADGCIVGTALKVDGVTWNPVDPARAERFMEAVRRV